MNLKRGVAHQCICGIARWDAIETRLAPSARSLAEVRAFNVTRARRPRTPRLHCMMVELIDDFFAEYPAAAGSDKVDTAEADEVIDAIAKTVAELTSQQDGLIRQQVIEHLMRQIMHCDGEFNREEATSAVGSHAKHWLLRVDWNTGTNSTLPPCRTGRGVIRPCKGPPSKIPKTPK
jgi:hypothetical protein